MKTATKVLSLLIATALIIPTVTIAGTDLDKPGWLGVNIRTVDDDLFVERNLDLDEPTGVLVMDVVPDSPADEAGLRSDDVILKFNGKDVTDADQLRELVASNSPGGIITLDINRGGDPLEVKATLTERKKSDRFGWSNNRPFDPVAPDINLDQQVKPIGYIGIGMSPLTEQLGDYFGVANGEGVLISEVMDDSPASRAGLKAGDIIVEINGEKIAEVRDVAQAIQGLSNGDLADIGLIRDHRSETLAVTVEEREGPVYGSLLNPDKWNLRGNLQDLNLPDLFKWQEFHQQKDRDGLDQQQDEMNDLRKDLEDLRRQFEKMRQDSK